MGGACWPVVINSGSGNQGMTVSLPVITYAKELGVSQETLYRALVLSNLTAIYIKSGIGKLSAFCGAVGAGCAAGAASPGCGAEIMTRFAAPSSTPWPTPPILSATAPKLPARPRSPARWMPPCSQATWPLAGKAFGDGEGLVAEDADATVRNIMRLGRDGMKETDIEILHMMIGQ